MKLANIKAAILTEAHNLATSLQTKYNELTDSFEHAHSVIKLNGHYYPVDSAYFRKDPDTGKITLVHVITVDAGSPVASGNVAAVPVPADEASQIIVTVTTPPADPLPGEVQAGLGNPAPAPATDAPTAASPAPATPADASNQVPPAATEAQAAAPSSS